jgi:hypothetical protein
MYLTIVLFTIPSCSGVAKLDSTDSPSSAALNFPNTLTFSFLSQTHNHNLSVGFSSKLAKRTKDPTDQPLTTTGLHTRSKCSRSHANGTQGAHQSRLTVVFMRYKTICGVAYSNLASSKTWASVVDLSFCSCISLVFSVHVMQGGFGGAASSKAAASLAEGCIINLSQIKKNNHTVAPPRNLCTEKFGPSSKS